MGLLHKKDRGKPSERGGDGNLKEFAALKADSFVPGAEILQEETDGTKDIGEEKMDEDKETDDEEEEDDDDADESDGWVDIVHSDDEMKEEEDGKDEEEKEIEQADAKQKAEAVSSSRILTDEDFKKIQTQSLAQQVEGKGKKRPLTATKENSTATNSDIVGLPQIETVCKKMRHDKESRLATVMQGREDREKFSKPKPKRQNEFASTTNKEKKKNKPFMMLSHSHKTRKKNKASFREKQIALRDAMLKKEKASKKR